MVEPEESLGYQKQDGDVAPLPTWAGYLVALGRFVVDHQRLDDRLVVGISLPTRSFAAAFAALGVAGAAYQDPEERDPQKNFRRIASMPRGTPIRFRRGRFLNCGRLIGVETINGVEHLTYLDGAKCYLPWDRCSAVEPLDPTDEFVRRRRLAPNAQFVESVLGIDPLAHAAYTCLDCVVVGVKDALRADIVGQQFVALRDGIPGVTGVLNDILRCDAFELNANDHDRTAVISGFTDVPPLRLREERPPAVVFDGPAGYLRLRSYWPRSPLLVLLDRTSPSAAAAADAFNQELALSIDDADLSAVGELPAELESRAYYEAAR